MELCATEENRMGLAGYCILALVFCIPISHTMKSIFWGCSLGAVLLMPQSRTHLAAAYNTLAGRMALVFFAFIVIACLWSPAPWTMQWMDLTKYMKLLLFPILAVGFINPKLRLWTIHSYLAAMFITCLLSIIKDQGILLAGLGSEVFYNHIITGLLMALATYLAAIMALRYQGWRRLVYLGLVLLTSYQVLFINIGRSGYLVYVLLMSLLLVQHLSFKKSLVGLLLFCGMLGMVYTQSHFLQERVNATVSEMHQFKHNQKNTSIGFRLQFYQYTLSLFKEHPFLGLGTGGFKYQFNQDNPIPTWGTVTADPHSQYWMTLAEHGLVGMLLLFLFLGALLITACQLQETKFILLGVLVVFTVGSLTDTLFSFSAIGYLLLVMSAMCLGEMLESRLSLDPIHGGK